MARPLRIEYPGALYHLTSRGNARQRIFLDKEDYILFLNLLYQVNQRYHFLCHAYCLMPNHYHLLIETSEGNLSRGMRQLNGVYTQSFNRRHRRIGHLFQGRYKAHLVEKESHLLEVARYIVLNPVRVRLAEQADKWPFSSYRSTAGLEKPHPCLTLDWVLAQFGESTRKARKRYMRFVQEGKSSGPIWENVKGQILLGSEGFAQQFSEYLKGYLENKEIPRTQRFAGRPSLGELFGEGVLSNFRLRNKKIVEAVEHFGYSQQEIATHLKMHYSTVSKLIKAYKTGGIPNIKT